MKSRIHFSLNFKAPDRGVRELLWKQQLNSIPPTDIDLGQGDVIDEVIAAELNGREIANTVNTARTIACFQKMPLKLFHLQMVLDAYTDFNKTLR